MENEKHTIFLENREALRITDVEDVERFEDDNISVITSFGRITVLGSDFKIQKLNVEDGQLEIDGTVDEIKYEKSGPKESGGFFSRMFQ